MQDGSKKAIVAAFGANLGIAVIKFIGFAITRSTGMLAEAIHSAADTGNQALLLVGSNRAKREASATHPFGYGRERYFWSFAVALVLFLLGGLFAIYEGIEKLRSPHEPEHLPVALAILGAAVVLEGFSFRTALREANHLRGKATMLQFVRRAKSPELPVVLLEDTGALLGLLIAIIGVIMAKATGNARWDAAGSLAIGILLTAIAIFLTIEMKSLLIGEAADDEQVDLITEAIKGSPEVVQLIHARTMHVGPEELLLAAKIHFRDNYTVSELAEAIDAVEARVRAAVPITRLIYLEPDIHRGP